MKVMFMGIVALPLPVLGFDGRILLKRISEKKVRKKISYNQHFSYDSILNDQIMENIGKGR